MSQDQKSAKLRVVGSGQTPAAARTERRGVKPEPVAAELGASDATSADLDASGSPLVPAALFLIACAGGGAAVAWLGLAA